MKKINIKNTQIFGFESALRGMRNPLNSWDRSDSFQFIYVDGEVYDTREKQRIAFPVKYKPNEEGFVLGESDEILAQKLTRAGSEHAKFLRQIHVWADFAFPRYFWQEFDQYHFHTTNSTSTMHKLMSRNLTLDDFVFNAQDTPIIMHILSSLNGIRYDYLNAQDTETKQYLLRRAKQLLPEGYLQMRTIDTNYAELLNMYKQRHNHKLKEEWQDVFSEWVLKLPYFKELTGIDS